MLPFFIFLLCCFLFVIWVGYYLFRFSLSRTNKKFLQTEIQDLPPSKKEKNPLLAQWLTETPAKEQYLLSGDGLQLYAKIYLRQSSHKWVIAVHGYRGRHTMMTPFAKMFHEKGFHVLCPDLRGHGNSQGDFIGMGWPDRKDIITWANAIIDMDKEAEIILFGVSMGAATVMMAAGETLPSQVKCVIEDCGYTSVYDQFQYQLKRLFHLPAFPFLPITRIIARIKTGMDFYEASAMKQIQNSRLPVLFIHGKEDTFVPFHMAQILYENKPGNKNILLVENAGHGQAFAKEPALYEKTVFQFIAQYL